MYDIHRIDVCYGSSHNSARGKTNAGVVSKKANMLIGGRFHPLIAAGAALLILSQTRLQGADWTELAPAAGGCQYQTLDAGSEGSYRHVIRFVNLESKPKRVTVWAYEAEGRGVLQLSTSGSTDEYSFTSPDATATWRWQIDEIKESPTPTQAAPQPQLAEPVRLPYTVRFSDAYWGTCEATITESKVSAHEVTPEGGDLSDVCDIAANRSNLELASSLVNQDHHWMIRIGSKDGGYIATHSSKRFGSGSEATIAIPVRNEEQARLVHAIVAHIISGTPLPTINGANSQSPSSARSPEAPNQPTEQIGEAEAGLNSTYSVIRNRLTSQQKESLKKDELQWIKWKDSLSPQEKLAAVQKRIAMLQLKYGTGAPQNTRNSEDTETQLAEAENNLNLVYRRIRNRLSAEQKRVLKQREVEWISMKDSLPAAQRVSEIHKRIQILEQEYGDPQ